MHFIALIFARHCSPLIGDSGGGSAPAAGGGSAPAAGGGADEDPSQALTILVATGATPPTEVQGADVAALANYLLEIFRVRGMDAVVE